MKCNLSIVDDESLSMTVSWLKSIGMNWVNSRKKLDETILDITFINTPSILEMQSGIETLSICNISNSGITFYLTDYHLGYEGNLEFDHESADGIVFCPMSNIESVNSIGRLSIKRKMQNKAQ